MVSQVSTVSKTMSAAAAGVLASSRYLVLQLDHQTVDRQKRLDSALLLEWAPTLIGLCLNAHSLNIPGLLTFVKAASKVMYLHIDGCNNLLAAAQAGRLLSSCSNKLRLIFEGSCTPSLWPQAMTSLTVSVAWSTTADPLMASALVHSLSGHRHLQNLSLDFSGVSKVLLVSELCLPKLVAKVEFILSERTVLDLRWLQLQPCSSLAVSVTVTTDMLTQHEHVINQLLPLTLHSLTVLWKVTCSSELQLLWQQLHISNRFTLDAEAFPPVDVLQALPHCHQILVIAAADLVLDWAAVTSQAAKFSIDVFDGDLIILGGCQVPDHLEGAWQVTFHLADNMQDLPGTQLKAWAGNMRFLQNAAAVSAGWIAEDRA